MENVTEKRQHDDPLISVIVPVYNVEKYLRECVDSLLQQTYKNLEIILVDDGSLDECGAICDEYEGKDSRVKVIHKENGGLSDARNTGLALARGAWIAFVDSDDWVEARYIEELYELCKKTNTRMSICKARKVFEDGTCEIGRTKKVDARKGAVVSKYYILQGYDGFYGTSWNRLCARELYDGIEFPTGRIHEDEGTTYKLVDQCSVISVIDKVLYHYRARKGSITNDKRNDRNLDILYLMREKCDFFEDKHEKDLGKIANIEYLFGILEKRNVFPRGSKERKYLDALYRKRKWYAKRIKTERWVLGILNLYDMFPFLYQIKGKSIYVKIVLNGMYRRLLKEKGRLGRKA